MLCENTEIEVKIKMLSIYFWICVIRAYLVYLSPLSLLTSIYLALQIVTV